MERVVADSQTNSQAHVIGEQTNYSTNKPTWKSGGSNNNDGNKYRIYTKQGNPVGYNEDGWDNHFWWKYIIEDVRGECAAMLYEDVKYVAKVIRLSFHDCKGHSEGYGCVMDV